MLYEYASGEIISEYHVEDVENVLYQFSEDSINALLRRSHSEFLEFSITYNNVVFSKDGKFIYTSAGSGYLLTYEIQTGRLHKLFAYLENVEGADFTGSKGLTYELARQLQGNGAIIDPEEFRVSSQDSHEKQSA